MKKLKMTLLSDTTRLLSLLLSLCAALCLIYGLYSSRDIAIIDNGGYTAVMSDAGLAYTQADIDAGGLQYTRPVTQFEYAHFSYGVLFSPSSVGSTVYAIAAVRLFTQPFGLLFSVNCLAAVWCVLLALAVYSLSYNLRLLLGDIAVLPIMLLCALFTDGNFCVQLRGLYTLGAQAAFTLLFAAAVLRAFAAAKGTGARCVLPVLVSGMLFLRSSALMAVFMPAVVAAFAVIIWRETPHFTRRIFTCTVLSLLALICCGTAVQGFAQSTDLFSDMSAYNSVFGTLLPASDATEETLAWYGLDESYAADAGLTYYADETLFAHNPRDEAEQAALFAAVTPAKTALYYITHLNTLARVLENAPYSLSSYESVYNVKPAQDGYTFARTDGGALSVPRLLLFGSYGTFFVLMLIAAAAVIVYAVVRKNKNALLALIFIICAAAYLPLALVLCGYDNYALIRLFAVFLQEITLFALLCAAVLFARRATAFIKEAAPEKGVPCTPLRKTGSVYAIIKNAVLKISGSRKATVLAVLFAAVLMTAVTEFKTPHAVGINNGDFGRLMGEIGITWSGNEYINTTLQINGTPIEIFAWTEPFDWQKLTFLKPTYSIYLFASIVRLFTQSFGLPFSIHYVALLMAGVTVICIAVLVNDLYDVFGRRTLFAGLALCAMLCCETYLVWYNSLYGESCVLIGLIMSVTFAVHIALIPRGEGRSIIWFVLLAVALYVLVCAKAQMLFALPGAVLLFCTLAWLHRPYRLDLRLLSLVCAAAVACIMCVQGVSVYNTDRSADSTSSKHTLWQTYFYGIFMICDNPEQLMTELGVDTAMLPDVGKFVDFGSDDYVYTPLSDEAQTAFYDHVSTGTALKWYLTHPAKLLYMLNNAARESHTLYTGYRAYADQNYLAAHDSVNGFALWEYWRPYASPTLFAGYVLFYGILLVAAFRGIFNRKNTPEKRTLWCVLLFIMLTGVLQYPLTVLGNGFADNQKQLFGFILCHDFIIITTAVLAAKQLWHLTPQTFKQMMKRRKNERTDIRHAEVL